MCFDPTEGDWGQELDAFEDQFGGGMRCRKCLDGALTVGVDGDRVDLWDGFLFVKHNIVCNGPLYCEDFSLEDCHGVADCLVRGVDGFLALSREWRVSEEEHVAAACANRVLGYDLGIACVDGQVHEVLLLGVQQSIGLTNHDSSGWGGCNCVIDFGFRF